MEMLTRMSACPCCVARGNTVHGSCFDQPGAASGQTGGTRGVGGCVVGRVLRRLLSGVNAHGDQRSLGAGTADVSQRVYRERLFV